MFFAVLLAQGVAWDFTTIIVAAITTLPSILAVFVTLKMAGNNKKLLTEVKMTNGDSIGLAAGETRDLAVKSAARDARVDKAKKEGS